MRLRKEATLPPPKKKKKSTYFGFMIALSDFETLILAQLTYIIP